LKDVSSVVVRGDYEAGKGLAYQEGQDYIVDHEAGEIRRTPGSRIPDYSTHPQYGLESFDHRKFEGSTSNTPFFVWVDYISSEAQEWAEPRDESAHLARARKKLEQGGKFHVATYGDSITAGGEASRHDLSFTHRYINDLRTRYPKADIVLTDVSIPGKTSREAVSMFEEKLGALGPQDLVLIGFGMNDHNRGGAEPEEFEAKLAELVRLTRAKSPDADIILFSAFPPNVAWQVATNRMADYAAATRDAAKSNACAYADVFGVWERVLQRKDQPSLLANNINHPNNFGHWLYFRAFAALGL
jgi:acyl-CoA thioesterase I